MSEDNNHEIVVCYNCKVRKAEPYFCIHCQWEMSSDKGFLKKLGEGKLWSKSKGENER